MIYRPSDLWLELRIWAARRRTDALQPFTADWMDAVHDLETLRMSRRQSVVDRMDALRLERCRRG